MPSHPLEEAESKVSILAQPASRLCGVSGTLLRLAAVDPSLPLPFQFGERQEYLRMEAARNTFGAFLPLSMAMERAAAAKVQRLPPLLSSNFSYEILTGEANCIDVHHVFNSEAAG